MLNLDKYKAIAQDLLEMDHQEECEAMLDLIKEIEELRKVKRDVPEKRSKIASEDFPGTKMSFSM